MKPKTRFLRSSFLPTHIALSLGLAVAGLSSHSAQAANEAWSTTAPGPANGNFGGTNWTVGTTGVATPTNAAATGDALYFDTSAITTLTNDLTGATFAGFTFNSGASVYTVGGNSFTLSGALTNNSSSLQTFSNAITLQNPQTITGAGNFSFGGNLTGAGTFTKSGAGTLVLAGTGTNTFSNYQFSGGLTQFTAGTSNFTANQGNSALNNGGSVEVDSGATVNVSDNNHGNNVWLAIGDTTGQTSTFTVNGGNVTLSSSWGIQLGRNGSGILTINSGTFSANDPNNMGLELGEGGTGIVNLNGGVLQVNKIYSSKAGSAFYFNGGTLKAADSRTDFFNNTANAATQVRNGGGSIDTNGFNITFAQAITHSTVGGDHATDGGLVKNGAGTLTLSAANTYTGATTVNGGTLLGTASNSASGGAFSSTSGITVNNGGTLKSTENGLFGYDGTKEQPITVNAGGTLTADAGVNINVGLVTLNGGTMTNGGAAANWGSWTFRYAGCKLAVTDDSTVSALNVHMRNGASIDVSANKNLNFNGTLTNANSDGPGIGALVKTGAGTLTLTGSNTYTGATTINSGTLQIGAGGAAGTLGTGAVTNNGVLVFNRSDSYSVASGITGSGSITISGSGITTLSGANTYTGATTVNGGTLNVGGSLSSVTVANGANLSNISGSVLTVGSLTFNGADVTNAYLSGGGPGIAVTGTLTTTPANGQVTLNITNSGAWAIGANSLISYGSFSGSASDFTLGTFSPTLSSRQSLGGIVNTGSSIALQINGDAPVWTGLQSGQWTTAAIGGASNWKLQVGGGVTDFQTTDDALFNDTATGTRNVVINDGTVSPNSTTFNTASSDYVLSGTDGNGINTGFLIKSGTGTVTLLTSNTYSGNTTINAGTLQLGDGTTNGSIPNSAIVNNGSLIYNLGEAQTQATLISGTGSLTKSGTGTLVLAGTNTYSGTTTINDGTLVLTATNANSGTTTINAGTLQLGDGTTNGAIPNSAIVNNGTLAYNLVAALTQSTLISGAGSLIKDGTDALTLTGANTYAGNTTLNAGTLVVGNNSALGTGAVALNSGTLTSSANSSNDPLITNAIIAGGGAIAGGHYTAFHIQGNITGSAALGLSATYNDSGLRLEGDNSGFTGTATVTGANVRLGTATAGSAAAKWVVDGNLQLDAAGTTTYNLGELSSTVGTGGISGHATNGSSTVSTISVGALNTNSTFSGIIVNMAANNAATGNADSATNNVLALTKVGSGTLTLTGTNTYTGTTTVNGGTLALGATGPISTSSGVTIAAGAALDATGATPFAMSASQTVTFKVDGTGTGSSGLLKAAALDITNAHVAFTIVNPLDDTAYVLATYTSLTGTAFATATAPAGYTINYSYNGGTQIALVKNAGYSSWASTHVGGQDAGQDFNNDGVKNGVAYFMGADGTSFTANPGVVDLAGVKTVTWPKGADFVGTYGTNYVVQTSSDLVTWDPVSASDPNLSDGLAGTQLVYTLPTGSDKLFVRLVVTPAP
jgi:fibronectin-binding autotransporter adhesin